MKCCIRINTLLQNKAAKMNQTEARKSMNILLKIKALKMKIDKENLTLIITIWR